MSGKNTSREYAAAVTAEDVESAAQEFDARVDHLLQTTCEVARALVGVHQAAMAMLVDADWTLDPAVGFVVIEPE
jgi:hypothetical protein